MPTMTSKFARRLLAISLLPLLACDLARADNFTWEPGAISGNWDSAANWAGPLNAVPDDNTDSALVDSTNTDPTLVANRTIGALTIRAGGDVFTGNGTNNYALTVQESLFQNGRTLIENASSSLTVLQSPLAIDFDTDDLIINAGGSLFLGGGAKMQVDRLADLNAGGQIAGNGLVEFNGPDTFYNDGVVRATGGGTLTFSSVGLTVFDLDGVGENGILVAENDSTLNITTATFTPFKGQLYIHQNGAFQMATSLSVADMPGSEVHFYGGNGTATLHANQNWLRGVVDIHSGTAVLATPTIVFDTATFTIHEGAAVQFDANTTIENPDSVVNEYNTTIIVNDLVEIGTGAGDFDWDGLAQNQVLSGHTIVNAAGDLRIDAAHIDGTGLVEVYSGTITMNSGNVHVQNAAGQWEIDGFLVMNNTAADAPVLSGADLEFSGDLSVGGTGASTIEADTTFSGAAEVNVQAGAVLRLGSSGGGSQAVIAGGQWTGAGTVSLNGTLTTISAATTVNMPNGTFDLDGDLTGDQVIVNAPLTLNVDKMDANLNNDINDNLRINSAGRLTMNLTDPAASYDIAGALELNGLGGGLSSLHLAGSDVRLLHTTNVTGNSASSARTEIFGDMTIGGAGSFQFRGGTASNPSWVRATASVTGTGDLVVASSGPGYLRLEDGASVEVELVNRGTVDLGPTAANASVAAYTQTSSGTYVASIDGPSPDTQYDQLTVTGIASLDGALEVLVNQFGGAYADPATPGTFDEFELVLASAITGQFDEFVYDGAAMTLSFTGMGQDRYYAGNGLFRVLDYDAAELDLLNYKALPGDANGDGFVDGSDFGIWNAHKFTAGTDWTSGDFNGDGVTDGSDFGIWNSNKFTSIALGRPGDFQAVPEPNGLLAVGLGLMTLSLRRRWHRS